MLPFILSWNLWKIKQNSVRLGREGCWPKAEWVLAGSPRLSLLRNDGNTLQEPLRPCPSPPARVLCAQHHIPWVAIFLTCSPCHVEWFWTILCLELSARLYPWLLKPSACTKSLPSPLPGPLKVSTRQSENMKPELILCTQNNREDEIAWRQCSKTLRTASDLLDIGILGQLPAGLFLIIFLKYLFIYLF